MLQRCFSVFRKKLFNFDSLSIGIIGQKVAPCPKVNIPAIKCYHWICFWGVNIRNTEIMNFRSFVKTQHLRISCPQTHRKNDYTYPPRVKTSRGISVGIYLNFLKLMISTNMQISLGESEDLPINMNSFLNQYAFNNPPNIATGTFDPWWRCG